MTRTNSKNAFGICDRTGFRYKLSDLVYESINGTRTGMRVGRDVADKDHPQNFIGRVRTADSQSLQDPRPDTSAVQSRALFGWNPAGHPELYLSGAVGIVTTTGD